MVQFAINAYFQFNIVTHFGFLDVHYRERKLIAVCPRLTDEGLYNLKG